MTDWTQYQKRLLADQAAIQQRLENSGRYGLDDAMNDQLGELSGYDNHPADIASELFERSKDLALRDLDQLQLQAIDRALDAIRHGTYGSCSQCGCDIPRARLDANPLATLCVPCKERDEQAHPDRNRPIEEEYLTPGFGRTNLDQEDHAAFDGEDAWQAVARFDERPGVEHQYEGFGADALDDNEGIVDDMDAISNEAYRQQLP